MFTFEDLALKAEIEAVPGLRLICLPDQPYAALAETVAMGDACAIVSLRGRPSFWFEARGVDPAL